MWYIYIVKCSDDSYYTGITTDISRRVQEHNTSPKWAKYTRCRRPVEMLYHEQVETKSQAAKREYEIKKLNRTEKQALIWELKG